MCKGITVIDYASIKRWSNEKKIVRVGRLAELIIKSEFVWPKISEYIDEVIFLFIQILKTVILEKNWDITPSQLLLDLIEEEIDQVYVLVRFRLYGTLKIVERFNDVKMTSERKRLRSALKQRGVI